MCGIWAVFGLASDIHSHCSSTFSKISHRGPDAWRLEYDNKIKNCCVGFHRLAIVDSTYGMQPMKLHAYPCSMLICNGEIYNCKKLQKQFSFKYETYCDVECIFHLYENFGIEECIRNLDGVFAFCIVDDVRKKIFLGRDPYGVRPLFTIVSESGIMGICSEAKGLVELKKDLKEEICTLKPFPPGTYEEYDLLDTGKVKLVRKHQYHTPGDRPLFKPFLPYIDLEPTNCKENIRNLLKLAVKKRLMADRRIGCLLSGGLDSSLIAALLVREAKEQNLPYKIQTFAIGMGDSPDLRAARDVSNHIGSEHHEVIFTEEDVARVLDDVIYTLETPDITTIRASIPMYLLSKYVAERTDTIVLFSGEGADEVAQGYIYFRDAPDAEAAHSDSIRLLKEIYMFDGLRADRTTASQGLELRTPFLDIQFTNYYLTLDRESKQPQESVEKYLLRSSFDRSDLLPNKILWREKEAFSDGVTSKKKSLFVVLQEIVDKRMPELFDKEVAAKKYPHCTPTSKEALYYREVFERSYPGLAPNFLPYYWMPRWNKNVTDPSARFIKHYQAAEN